MRTLDDIIPPSKRKEMETGAPVQPSAQRQFDMPTSGGKRGGFPYRTVIGALVVIALVVGGLFYFSGAKVTVTPATVSVNVSGSFTALKNQGDLTFGVITAQKVATQSVAGSGTQNVNSSASGSVTIYNTQSKVQTLVANTRFQTKSGLIFRIHQTVSIPAGSSANPGSKQVTVYADQAGDTYNIAPTSFSLPGLANTPQFSQVYATSNTSMAGGASGTVPVVPASMEASTRTALVAALGPDLMNQIRSQIPDGYVLLPGAATTTYQAQTSSPSATTGMVDVKEQGTVTAVVFPQSALAAAIAKQTLSQTYNSEPLTFASTDSLTLTSSTIPDTSLDTYTFSLSGAPTLVYNIDSSRIAAAIAGKTPASAEVVLTALPEVKTAVLVLHPVWKKTFPEDPSQIQVVVTKP